MIRNKRIMRLAAAILCLAVIGSGMSVYAAAEAAPEETDPLPETYLLQLEQTEHGGLLADGTEEETRGVVTGKTVTLQAFPEDGYELQAWETDGTEWEGKELEVSFTMPAQDVIIRALFVEQKAEESLKGQETEGEPGKQAKEQLKKAEAPAAPEETAEGRALAEEDAPETVPEEKPQLFAAGLRGSIYIQNSGTIQYPADFGNAYEWDYWVDGNRAYCVNPQMAGPESGYYSSSAASEISNQALAKVLYYGYGGDGDITANVIGGDASRRHVVTHIASAIAYGDPNPYYNCTQAGIDAANQFYAAALAQPDLPAGSFQLIRVHAADGLQDIAYLIIDIQYGNLAVQKSSANPTISDNNACYSLEGAVFTVYQTGTDQVVGMITTDAGGYGRLEHLQTGSYDVQETTAPKGFLLDSSRHTVNISGNATFTYYFTDEPGNDPINIFLFKRDIETEKPQGSAKLKGAEYTVKYYDTEMATDPAEAGLMEKYTWILKTDENGRVYLDNAHKISGDEFVIGLHGNPVLPLGTITIQERKAPEGYLLNNTVYVANTILQNGSVSTTNLPNDENYAATEQVKRGDLEFIKLDADDDSPMVGIPFRITSETTGESHIIVTDENGHVSTKLAKHSYQTNSNDGVTDESDYSSSFGVWFGESDPDDNKGALLYDTYTLEELSCSANYGKDLLVLSGIPVMEAGVSIDLGELSNQTIRMKSEAVDTKTGTHTIAAGQDARIADTYIFQGLTAGRTYRLEVTARDAETGEAILKDGQPVMAETSFLAGTSVVHASVELSLDTSELAGKGIVCTAQLYWNGIPVASHESLDDQSQTVYVPTMGTTARDGQTGSHTGTVQEKTTLVDTVEYTGLTPGKEYRVSGTLMVRETGKALLADGQPVTAEAVFTPKDRDGSVELVFSFDSSALAGQTLVAFETITYQGIHVVSHEEIDEEGQSVHYPEIGTSARDASTGDSQTAVSEATTILDTVTLSNLVPGETYTLKGRLTNRETGSPLLVNGKEVTTETIFTAENASGSLGLSFTFDAASCQGKTLVVFEELYRGDVLLAAEVDLENEGQTLYVPDIRTTAKDQTSGNHTGTIGTKTVITDTVSYSNLLPGKEYRVSGKLMLQSTGKPLLVNGKEVAAETTFLAEEPSGTVELSFLVDSSSLWGETLVVFENLYREGILLTSHADLEDDAQSILYPKLGRIVASGGSRSFRTGRVATGDVAGVSSTDLGFILAAALLICLVAGRAS